MPAILGLISKWLTIENFVARKYLNYKKWKVFLILKIFTRKLSQYVIVILICRFKLNDVK